MMVTMTVADMVWVRSILGSDSATNFDGLEDADRWYVRGCEDGVEVVPATPYDDSEDLDAREGFYMVGTVDDVVASLQVMGFPTSDY